MPYTAKTPIVTNTTLTNANTWYQVASAISSIRKWRMKARESTDNSFDYVFNPLANPNSTPPSVYMTNSGPGVNFDGCSLPELCVRSATAGTVIELEYGE